MAKVEPKATIGLELRLTLSEPEARALNALVGYGVDSFLKVFYERMGLAYLEPHEAGLLTLFQAIKDNVPSILGRLDQAHEAFESKRKPD